MTAHPEPELRRCVYCLTAFEYHRTHPNDPPRLYCTPEHRALAAAEGRRLRERLQGSLPVGVCPVTHKTRYATADDALAVILSSPTTRVANRPYLCSAGDHYHLGRIDRTRVPTPVLNPVQLPPTPAPSLPPGARPGPPPRRTP